MAARNADFSWDKPPFDTFLAAARSNVSPIIHDGITASAWIKDKLLESFQLL
jgi:hypothetical protein